MQIEEYIKLEQAKAVYENTKILISGAVAVSLVTLFVFWSEVPSFVLYIWIGAAVGIIIGRLLTLKAFRGNTITIENSQNWLNISLLWSFLTGCHWGLIPTYFLTTDATQYTVFVSIIYTGYLSGAISTNSAYPYGFIALGVPTTLCFAGRFFYEGGSFYNTIGIMVVFYFATSLLLARKSGKLFREARELNFKNMSLIDELVVQKDAAVQATQSKDRFLAAASHDLRQPLHSSGLLLSALEQYVDGSKGKALLQDIRMSGEALSHSFNSLLDVSRLDAGVVESNIRSIDLTKYLQPLLRDGQVRASEKGLTFNNSGEHIAVNTDSILFKRIVGNLVSNAIAYTSSGNIEVEWSKINLHYARIIIKDSGIGIDPSQFNDIFSEYYQVDNPERDREKGFGLGLSIVQRLCTMLNIGLYVSSVLGEGTTFALYIQLGNLSDTIKTPEQIRSLGNLQSITALVIDDDASVRKSMSEVLQVWGCKVITEASQESAVTTVSQLDTNLDLIVADYRLRDNKTGAEAIEAIRDELNQAIPAIIVTGDTSPERLQQLTMSGLPVLHKPVSASALRAAIQQQIFT